MCRTTACSAETRIKPAVRGGQRVQALAFSPGPKISIGLKLAKYCGDDEMRRRIRAGLLFARSLCGAQVLGVGHLAQFEFALGRDGAVGLHVLVDALQAK